MRLIPAAGELSPRKGFFAIYVFFGIVVLYFATGGMPLLPDEAQYWTWSRRLQLCYVSKPPFIAYVNAAATALGGHHVWVIRVAGSVFHYYLFLPFMYVFGSRLAGSKRGGLIAAMATVSLSQSTNVVMDTNQVLSIFWIAAMGSFYLAISGSTVMWWLLGMVIGLGLLCKFTMLLLVVAFALYLVLFDRAWWRTRYPYLVVVIAVLINAGSIWWNMRHNWAPIDHMVAESSASVDPLWKRLWDFGSQQVEFLGLSAVLVIAAIGGLARCWRQKQARFLLVCWAVPFGFYLIVALKRLIWPHWTIQAYYAVPLALGWLCASGSQISEPARRTVTYCVKACCMLLVAFYAAVVVLAPLQFEPRIGDAIVNAVNDHITDINQNREFVLSDDFSLASFAEFFLPGHPHGHLARLDMRHLYQEDLWEHWDSLAHKDAVFLCYGDEGTCNEKIRQLVSNGVFREGKFLRTGEYLEMYNRALTKVSFAILYDYTGKSVDIADGLNRVK
jgi:hypothetical protein